MNTLAGPPPTSVWRRRLQLGLRGLAQNWALFSASKIGMTGLVIIVFFALLGALYPAYPWIMEKFAWDETRLAQLQERGSDLTRVYDPFYGIDETLDDPGAPNAPSWRHPLGTADAGPDILAQLLYSTGRAFLLGVLAALITVVIGTLVGAVAAYYGGLLDALLMRVADVFVLTPAIAFLVVISMVLEAAKIALDLWLLAVILGLFFGFGSITIVLKSQALTIKVKPYIEAARVAGGSDFHIILAHIIPNLLPLSFLYMMFNVTTAIFSEAALSFFGLLPHVKMSWGIMLYQAYQGRLIGPTGFEYWYLWVPPGLAVTLLCSAFYLVGRGLDEMVNPRLRRR
jgi:peptide/nickel transport system permease protein